MKDAIIKILATGAGAGYSPVMPGTVGTLWGMAAWYFASGLSPWGQAAVTGAVILVSIYVSEEAVRLLKKDDPSEVVIDEVAGLLVAALLIPFTPKTAIIVFILFRIFDIVKPYPVSAADRSVKGGLGVVLDDVIAGIYANILARLILWYVV